MRESALLRGARCPVFTLHYAIVGCWAAECDPIPLIIRSHASECTAARHQSFKVIDMRWFQIRPGRLIVTTVFVQPRNGVGIGASICGSRILQRAECGQHSCRSPESAELQKTSAAPNRERFRREPVHSNLLTHGHPNSLNRTLRPKRSTRWQNFTLASIVTACPLRPSVIAWTHFLLQVRDTDLMWIVGLRLETKSARFRM